MEHQDEEDDTTNQMNTRPNPKRNDSEIKTIRIRLIRNKHKKEDINERDNPQQEKSKNLKMAL